MSPDLGQSGGHFGNKRYVSNENNFESRKEGLTGIARRSLQALVLADETKSQRKRNVFQEDMSEEEEEEKSDGENIDNIKPIVADFIDMRAGLLESELIQESEPNEEPNAGVNESQKRDRKQDSKDELEQIFEQAQNINTDRSRSRSRKRYQKKLDSECEIQDNLEEKRRKYQERALFASLEDNRGPNKDIKTRGSGTSGSRRRTLDRDASPGMFRSVDIEGGSQYEDQKYLEFLKMDKSEPSRKSMISEERRRELSNKLRRSQFEDKFDEVVNFKEFVQRPAKKRKSEFFAESAYSDMSQISKGEKDFKERQGSLERRRNRIKRASRDYHTHRPKSAICKYFLISFVLKIRHLYIFWRISNI